MPIDIQEINAAQPKVITNATSNEINRSDPQTIASTPPISASPGLPSLVSTSLTTSQEIKDLLLKNVIIPVSGDLPEGVEVKCETSNGQPSIIIEHTTDTFQFKYSFIPHIGKISTPDYPQFPDVHTIKIPFPNSTSDRGLSWTEPKLKAIQHAWRRAIIADPILNKRNTQEEIRLDDFQQEAVDKTLDHLLAGNQGALIEMATATGKTLVVFAITKRLLEHFRKNEPKRLMAVNFLVNNSIILDEAREKLQKTWKADDLKIARVYDDTRNEPMDGDFIFATPSSIIWPERLKQLKQQPIVLVIFDETHHIAAPTLRKIYNELKALKPKFIGLTATSRRPDRKPVLPFFGQATFRLPTITAVQIGAIVPFRYEAADFDINPGNISPVVPGTAIYDKYVKYRYSENRFEHIFNQYEDHTRDLHKKKTLIIAPNIKKAQALKEFFRARGINAISLTTAEKKSDKKKFYENYYAWRTGHWSDPVCKDPVPEVVIAIDIFQEGIDVPDIGLLMLWRYTNSHVKFVQSIGRGLRQSPYKKYLKVVDLSGQFRNWNVMKYLYFSAGFDRFDKTNKILNRELDFPELEKSPELSEEEELTPIASLSEDVTENIMRLMNHVPSQIEEEYGKYSNLDESAKRILDEYIASSCSFESSEELYKFLGDFANAIREKSQEVKNYREKLLPAFYIPGVWEGEAKSINGIEIPNTGATRMVFSRLHDLLINNTICELTNDQIFRIFREFDPKTRDLRNCFCNLRLLRTLVFNKSPEEMFLELIQNVLENNEVSISIELREFLEARQENYEELKDEAAKNEPTEEFLEILLSEGYHPRISHEDIHRRIRNRLIIQENKHYIKNFAEAYLAHPKISKTNMQVDDLYLPKKDFLDLLLKKGLLSQSQTSKGIHSKLVKAVRKYENAIRFVAAYTEGKKILVQEDSREAEYYEALEEARKELNDIVTSEILLESSDVENPQNIRNLLHDSERINTAHNTLSSDFEQEMEEVRKNFDHLLECSGARCVVELESLPDVKLIIEPYRSHNKDNEDKNKFKIKLESTNPTYKAHIKGNDTLIYFARGFEDKLHAVISDEDLTGVETLYEELNEFEKPELIDLFIKGVEILRNSHKKEEEMVYVIPQDKPGHIFYRDLFEALIHEHEVLGQVIRTKAKDGRFYLLYNYKDIERSNLSILDPEKIQELREFFKACHTSVNNVHVFSFPALFLTEIRNNILPLLQDVQKRIQTLNIEDQTKVRELIESIQSTKQQPSIKSHIEKIEEVKRMLKSLARDDKPTI